VALHVPLHGNVRCAACERPAGALWLSNLDVEDGRRVRFNEITPCGCRVYLPLNDPRPLPRRVRR
jgi:hypothetical protein